MRGGGKQSLTHATGLMTDSSTPLGETVAPSDAVAIFDDRGPVK